MKTIVPFYCPDYCTVMTPVLSFLTKHSAKDILPYEKPCCLFFVLVFIHLYLISVRIMHEYVCNSKLIKKAQ